MSHNRLSQETSPYLLQHKDNPVHWMGWSEQALQEAQKRNQPILLSVGYAACHWCHVMAHESFEDPVIADLMNQNFINIKGRSRRAPRYRPYLHGGPPQPRRTGRLAPHHVPDPGRPSLLGRHLLPARNKIRQTGLSPCPDRDITHLDTRSETRSPRTLKPYQRPCSNRDIRQARTSFPPMTSIRRLTSSSMPPIRNTAASKAPPNFRKLPYSLFCGKSICAPGMKKPGMPC